MGHAREWQLKQRNPKKGWISRQRKQRCGLGKSLDVEAGGAQPSKATKAGAADFVLACKKVKAGPAPNQQHVTVTLTGADGAAISSIPPILNIK